MKVNFTRSLLALLALSGTAVMNAQDAKIMSFTVSPEDAGKSITLQIGVTANQQVKVDWGNKSVSDPVLLSTQNDPYNSVSGTIAGTEIIVYGTDPNGIKRVNYTGEDAPKMSAIDLSALTSMTYLSITDNNIATLDLSACTSLETLEAANNALTKLTLPSTETLKTIDVSNTVKDGVITAGSNEVLGTDWSKAPKLTSLKVSGNTKLNMISFLNWEKFDISKNTELVTLEMNGSKQKELNIAANKKLKTLRADYNNLTSLDASSMLANASIQANNNQLTSIKIPANYSGTLQIMNNSLTFVTLPVYAPTSAYKYKFAPQAIIPASISGENVVDLSAQAKVGETASTFVWKTGETTLVEGTDYTAKDGVFTFLKDVKDAYCEIKNDVFYASGTAGYNQLIITTGTVTSPGLIPLMMSYDVKVVDKLTSTFTMTESTGAGMDIYVDWGDGVKAGPYKVTDDSYAEISAAPKGKTIKIYGDPALVKSFSSSANYNFNDKAFGNIQIESIDLSKLVNLQSLTLNQHLFSTVDLSSNKALTSVNLQQNKITTFDVELPKLKTLDLSNNGSTTEGRTLGENKPEVNFAKLPALTDFYANYTGINLDFTKTGSATTIRLIGNELENVDLSASGIKATNINLNYNKLATLDASGLSAKASLFLIGNELTSITLPEDMTGSLNISNNKFTFATLPTVWTKLTYSPQAPMEVAVADGNVDLSAQVKVGTTETIFTWKNGSDLLAEGTDYTVAGGVFTFLKDFENAACTMTNAACPKLTLNTVALNIKSSGIESIDANENAPVEYYDLHGIRVSGDAPGLYIRRQGNKTTKVLVK